MIRIQQLNLSVGTFRLQDVSLHIAPGEYFVLLGPTGSGKTLLVESLCGLNRIDGGRVLIDGTDVTGWEPRNRGVGYLPQDYALFPHLSVRRNIGFGLRQRRIPAGEIRQRVDRLMKRIGVEHLADRVPRKLSGGEKQRVALARALAIEPAVLVLDEPVSALDEQTRDHLCRRLKQLQEDTRTTTVHVSHNFAEMLAVADRVGIVYDGRLVQVGTPQEVMGRPKNTLVAQFVQAGNLLHARATADGESVRLTCSGGPEFRIPRRGGETVTGQVVVMVRPENIRLTGERPEDTPPRTVLLEGSITGVVDLGAIVKVHVACGLQTELLASLGKTQYHDQHLTVGDRVHLAIAPNDIRLLQE